MQVRVETVQLGRYQTLAFDQGTGSWAIVLPGAGYSAQAPMLWYARRVALEAGRSVLVVTDVFDRQSDDPVRWVEDRVEAMLSHIGAQDAHPLLITKSLASLAARLAAEQGLPAEVTGQPAGCD